MTEYRKNTSDIRDSDVKIAEVADSFPAGTPVIGVRADVPGQQVKGHVKPGGYGVIQEAGPRQGAVVVDVITADAPNGVPCLAATVTVVQPVEQIAPTPSELAERLANAIKAFPPGTKVVGLDHNAGRPVSGEVWPDGFGYEANMYVTGYGRPYVRVTSGQGTVKVYADTLSYANGPVELPGTTKIVTAVVTARFTGDYHDSGEVGSYLKGWIDRGLNDRDDLRAWDTRIISVTERPATSAELD